MSTIYVVLHRPSGQEHPFLAEVDLAGEPPVEILAAAGEAVPDPRYPEKIVLDRICLFRRGDRDTDGRWQYSFDRYTQRLGLGQAVSLAGMPNPGHGSRPQGIPIDEDSRWALVATQRRQWQEQSAGTEDPVTDGWAFGFATASNCDDLLSVLVSKLVS